MDKAFERLFGYQWGTELHFDDESSLSTAQEYSFDVWVPQRQRPSVKRHQLRGPNVRFTARHKHYQSTIPRSGTRSAANNPTRTSGARSTGTTSAPPASGVDAVLASLEAPAKLSTVAKMSKDWDQFKETSGLGTKLEEGADRKNDYSMVSLIILYTT